MYKKLLDLDTLYAVQKAAPQVTSVPFDLACWVVRGMVEYSKDHTGNIDQGGSLYWECYLKTLHDVCHFETGVSNNQVGKACRSMGLSMWRKMDGMQVAWSSAQLDILKKYFKA